jgi:formyl-CoA transferase
LARDTLVELPHLTAGSVKLTGSPFKLSRTPVHPADAPPLLGQCTEQVLHEYLGYTPADIAQLRDESVI